MLFTACEPKLKSSEYRAVRRWCGGRLVEMVAGVVSHISKSGRCGAPGGRRVFGGFHPRSPKAGDRGHRQLEELSDCHSLGSDINDIVDIKMRGGSQFTVL